MSRPRIRIGTFGEVGFINRPDGRVEACTRFRDWDGQTRLTQATASSRATAEVALKKKLAECNAFQPVDTTLTPDSPFPALVDYWLADLDLEGRIAASTRRIYEDSIRKLVMPAFAGFTLREIGVARCDALLKQLAGASYSKASGRRPRCHSPSPWLFAMRCCRGTRRQRLPTAQAEADADRTHAGGGQRDPGRDQGPGADPWHLWTQPRRPARTDRRGHARHLRPDRGVLAIRRCDLDVTANPALLRITGTLIANKGEPVLRQDHSKPNRSNRIVAHPMFTAEVLRRRLSVMTDHSPEALIFASRNGTPLTTANVRRQLRKVLGDAGIECVSPHMFRRTVATVINEQASVNLAAELLGHTDPKVTIEHYIRRRNQTSRYDRPRWPAHHEAPPPVVSGQFSCPPAGSFVAVSGQFLVAADRGR